MPIYTYTCENEKCEQHNIITEEKRPIDDRNRRDMCKCGEEMTRTRELTANPQFRGEFTPRFHK